MTSEDFRLRILKIIEKCSNDEGKGLKLTVANSAGGEG